MWPYGAVGGAWVGVDWGAGMGWGIPVAGGGLELCAAVCTGSVHAVGRVGDSAGCADLLPGGRLGGGRGSGDVVSVAGGAGVCGAGGGGVWNIGAGWVGDGGQATAELRDNCGFWGYFGDIWIAVVGGGADAVCTGFGAGTADSIDCLT